MVHVRKTACIAVMAFALEQGLPALTAIAEDLVDVGPLGTASQSSQYPGFPASNAIDGDFASSTHTNVPDAAATWQVDFGTTYPIQEIVLYNRGDGCCPERLRDITVSILAEDGTTVAYESDLLNRRDQLSGPATLEIDLLLEAGGPVSGRIVRVARTKDPTGGVDAYDASVLSLGEVDVLVDSVLLGPVIQSQPTGGTKYAGECQVFSVSLFNVGRARSIEYRWQKDARAIDGATGPRLVLGSLAADDAGSYEVVVTVDARTVVSNAAVLVVAARNLARGGIATQSTTAYGGFPARAIDGNRNGILEDGSVTHTDDEPQSWWQVKLYGDSVVESLVLWNRTEDCCRMRLSNLRVSALDANGDEVWGRSLFSDLSYPETSYEVALDGVACRTIRIQRLGPDREGSNYLSLAEVEVLGSGPIPPPDPIPNLTRACGAVTRQSSQLGEFGPHLAANGDLDDYTHTTRGNDGLGPPTWEVLLGAESEIGRIVLHNRTDCCRSRLRDITVSILDAAGELVWESELLNPENEFGTFPLGPPSIDIDLLELAEAPITGQTIRVSRRPDPDLSGSGGLGNEDEADALSLGEVEIFPPAPGPSFRRGDANDDGTVDISDGVTVLGFLFLGTARPPCLEASDADADGRVIITDAIYILQFLFLDGPEPPPPGALNCGSDRENGAGELGCAESTSC